ncbi:MAG: THUMP domain-containing protein [Thermoplasmatota archaeon]
MKVLIELALDHPSLPAAEARAALEVVGGAATGGDRGIVLADLPSDRIQPLADRLALARTIDAWWASAANVEALTTELAQRPFPDAVPHGTFAVRVHRVETSFAAVAAPDLARSIGAIIGQGGARVDLASPDVEVRIVLSDALYAGRLLASIDRKSFEARHVANRPFFSPIVLHPRIARAMANMARIGPGARVLDPFCGTGGLLLEAALLGAKVWGSDIDPRMAAGTLLTLEHFGCKPEGVEERDVGEAPEFVGSASLDAVLTDPPYGRSATTAREGPAKLYDRFFAAAAASLRPAGWLVAGFPSRRVLETPRRGLSLVESHDIRVHKSLTRSVGVWRKHA